MGVMAISNKFSFWSLVKISRPVNLVILAFAQMMTAVFLVETTPFGQAIWQSFNLYLLMLATSMVAAAGYMINDYYDVKIDYVNKPDEVIIGRTMKRRVALFYHSLLNFLAIGLGWLLSPQVALIIFMAAFLLWLYSNLLKRQPFIGNFTVALLTGASILLIGFYYQKSELLVLTFALFAFFMNLIREIIKDIEDMDGDRKHGCKTLPIILGFRNTKKVIFAIALVFVCSILVVTFKINNPKLYFYFAGLSILFMIFMYKIYLADRKQHFTQLSIYNKILMLAGILSMVFL
jgi:4-hydroxybenzoate polyprenyltransferase